MRDCARYILPMAPSAIRALSSALQTRQFDRAYLFHGDDDYLKEAQVRAVIASATDTATREFNLDIRRASEVDADWLAMALSAPPMMALRRVVVIRDVASLRKSAQATLIEYLRAPAAEIVLLLVAGAGTKPAAEIFGNAVAVEFKPLSEDNLFKWVLSVIAAAGATIDPRAAELLCRATGNDLALLAGEIEKLRSYSPRSTIDESAVVAVVGLRHGETLADLLELLAARDGRGALAVLEGVLVQPKVTGVSILLALTTQTLAMGWAHAARARGLPQHQMERELFALLKESPGSFVGRPWGEAIKIWIHSLRHWDDVSIDRALQALLRADVALKETRISSEEQVLTSLVLAMAVQVPREVAA